MARKQSDTIVSKRVLELYNSTGLYKVKWCHIMAEAARKAAKEAVVRS